MAKGRKQVTFDLDTKAAEKYYPTDSWRGAYNVIRRHMQKNGFQWLQGSVYVSKMPITSAEVTNILDELLEKNPWLNLCMRDCRESNIGREHSKNHLFDKNMELKPRVIEESNQMMSLLENIVSNSKTQEDALYEKDEIEI